MSPSALLPLMETLGLSGERAHADVRRLHASDRWSTFPRYQETAAFCAERLREAGLEVEVLPFRADGRTKFGDWMMPHAWDVRSARLEVAGAGGQSLADYASVPQSLVMWSAPTPPEGSTAEVVALEGVTPDALAGRDLRGKILLTAGHPTAIKAAAARAGALGIVSDWTRASGLPDLRQWINTWSDTPGGWAMHARDSQLWGFTLSPRQGAELRARLKSGPVQLRAHVDSRLYAGKLQCVTGALPGRTDEEVLLTAHVNEQGGNDNAAGASAVLEVARRLAEAVRAGSLEPPRRTVRFLLMPESYGTMAYAELRRDSLRRTVAALNVDSGAGDYDHPDSVLDLFPNPHCCPNYADGVMVGVAQASYAAQGRPDKWRLNPYMLAGDNFFCDPLIGVPHPWMWMGDGGDFWHNTGDTPERVDPRSLTDLCRIVAGFVLVMGWGTDAETEAFARATRESLPPELRALLRFPGETPPLETGDDGDGGIPVRTLRGALTLDGIPTDQWEGVAEVSPRWWGPKLAAWWWADGTRSVEEIAARLEGEFGPGLPYPTPFFEGLARLGYVTWH